MSKLTPQGTAASETTVTVPFASSVRLVYRFLRDNHLYEAAAVLQREAMVSCRTFSATEQDEFRDAVLRGEWDVALKYSAEALLSDAALFVLWEGIILDLIFRAVLTDDQRERWPGLDATTALHYADEAMKRHPVLQKLRDVEQARYNRLHAKLMKPSAADFVAPSADDAPSWRRDVWSTIAAELTPSTEREEAQSMDAWASIVLNTPLPGQRTNAVSSVDADADDRRLIHLAARREDALRTTGLEQLAPFEGSLRESSPCAQITRPTSACVVDGLLAVASEDGTFSVFTSTMPVSLLSSCASNIGILCVCAVKLGDQLHFAAGNRGGVLQLFNNKAERQWQQQAQPNGVVCVAAGGVNTIVTGGFLDVVYVFNAKTGQRIKAMSGQRPVSSIFCFATADGAVRAVSGSTDGTIRLWNCGDGSQQAVASAAPWGDNAAIAQVRQMKNGNVVALKSDGSLALLDSNLNVLSLREPSATSRLRDATDLLVTGDGCVVVVGAKGLWTLYAWEKSQWAVKWERQVDQAATAAGSGRPASSQFGPVATFDALGRCLMVSPGAVSVFT